ncbi:NADP-specific glutamate dehydrogenase [Candidatus Marinimicrobia bacterium]|nr:NADP-specific glutamate dehydrogenase [Candidatus Neomarinimicrobiota bacterium]
MHKNMNEFLDSVKLKNPHELEFHQAVHEVIESIWGFVSENLHYQHNSILERITEPERVLMFRVPWVDDQGIIHVNKGFRVEFNSAIGPYKGGLRFHPSVNLSILKFLGFEQVFKNSLTTLPMGGGKGGADFDPKGKSDAEVMRFCQSFMTELSRHIGQHTDVPAGDIGVGGREIGFMFGQYKRIKNEFTGVLTGKGLGWGGSLIRPEATGYGAVYFAEEMLKTKNESFDGKIVTISGSGNVAQFAAEKVIELGGKVVTLSDSSGTIFDSEGLNLEKLDFVKDLKNNKRGRVEEYTKKYNATYEAGKKPWIYKCDVAIPCATQNEISIDDAKELIKNNCICVVEGANMPTETTAVHQFIESKILFGPGKAANAGGVAVSGLEMSQNSMRLNWSRDEVDQKLNQIMKSIHQQCIEHGTANNYTNYVKGANIAGFIKVANAMIDQGVV